MWDGGPHGWASPRGRLSMKVLNNFDEKISSTPVISLDVTPVCQLRIQSNRN